MKRSIFSFLFLLIMIKLTAQLPEEYISHVRKADSLRMVKDYAEAASAYSTAFTFDNGKAKNTDRYNAACVWALTGHKDSAFHQLMILAQKAGYTNYNHVVIDDDFKSLHEDSRWQTFLALIKENKEKTEVGFIKPAVAILDSMYQDDQRVRQGMMELIQQYGEESAEVRERGELMGITDSINLIRLTRILNEWGWLGPDHVGKQGALTLFLVIQHSGYATQKKYLPMLRTAVEKKQASPLYLAYVEDRVALEEGREQIYGSQYAYDAETGKYFLRPLLDPENVDKRRAAVGLGSLDNYLRQLGSGWDLTVYQSPEAERRRQAYEAKIIKVKPD